MRNSPLRSTLARGGQHFGEHVAQPVHLIDQIQNNTDTLCIDAEIVNQIADQLRPRPVRAKSQHSPRSRASQTIQHVSLDALYAQGSP